jgi:hypothetical protein
MRCPRTSVAATVTKEQEKTDQALLPGSSEWRGPAAPRTPNAGPGPSRPRRQGAPNAASTPGPPHDVIASKPSTPLAERVDRTQEVVGPSDPGLGRLGHEGRTRGLNLRGTARNYSHPGVLAGHKRPGKPVPSTGL